MAQTITTSRRLRRSRRVRASVLGAAFALIASPAAFATAIAAPACRVVDDAAPAVTYGTLQDGVDAAGPGDTLRVKGTCVGNTTILKPLTVAGAPRATLDGGGAGSVLTIQNGPFIAFPPVTLVGLTITHGQAVEGGGIVNFGTRLTLVDSMVVGNVARNGGGIWSDHATVILEDSTVAHNTADDGGGIGNATNELHLFGSSSVQHNSARLEAGGVSNGDGSVHLHDRSTIEHNTAGGNGGGVASFLGRVILDGSSSIRHNASGADGGGVYNDFPSSLTLSGSSSIDHNTATGDGGGVDSQRDTDVTLADDASIAHNRAEGDGGGIWVSNFDATLTNAVAGVNVVHNRPDEIFQQP